MNRTRLLMIGVLALALGALVSVSVYRNLLGRGPANTEPGTDVVVAANDIQVGARIEEHDVRLVKYPASALPAGTPSKRSQVLGRGVILPIARGEFILPSKLAPENAGAGLPSLIPPGMRAVSVRVNEVVSVAGFVGPGTRVDILLTGTPGGSVRISNDHGSAERSRHCLRAHAGTQRCRRSAEHSSDHFSCLARGRRAFDSGQHRRQDSTGPAQSARYSSGSRWTQQMPGVCTKAERRLRPPRALPVHPVKQHKTEQARSPPSVLSVEVYQGDKKPDVVKFPEQSGEDPK